MLSLSLIVIWILTRVPCLPVFHPLTTCYLLPAHAVLPHSYHHPALCLSQLPPGSFHLHSPLPLQLLVFVCVWVHFTNHERTIWPKMDPAGSDDIHLATDESQTTSVIPSPTRGPSWVSVAGFFEKLWRHWAASQPAQPNHSLSPIMPSYLPREPQVSVLERYNGDVRTCGSFLFKCSYSTDESKVAIRAKAWEAAVWSSSPCISSYYAKWTAFV